MSKPVLKGHIGTLCLRAIQRAAAAKKGKRNWVQAPADLIYGVHNSGRSPLELAGRLVT